MVKKNEEKGITKSEMVELLSISKAETMELFDKSKKETAELVHESKKDMLKLLSEQFETVFKLIDDVKIELKNEIKFQIGEFRKEMNYRFLTVESNMVYKHEHEALVHRVEKLEE